MLNTCSNCGACRVDKVVDPAGPFAICPECGSKSPFRMLPLLMVSGASGVGKSSVCRILSRRSDQAVLMESDILWRPEFDKPEEKYRDYFEMWLRVCKNISQAGRPVVLFGAGMGVPENIEPCLERRYFSKVHYLALTCGPGVHRERFYQGKWRKSMGPDFLESHIRFNQWFVENAHRVTPAIDLIDTTDLSVEETSARVADWIHDRLNGNL